MQTKTPKFQLAHLGSELNGLSVRIQCFEVLKLLHTLILLAIRARFVAFQFQQRLDSLLILSGSLSGGTGSRPSRHRAGQMEMQLDFVRLYITA